MSNALFDFSKYWCISFEPALAYAAVSARTVALVSLQLEWRVVSLCVVISAASYVLKNIV